MAAELTKKEEQLERVRAEIPKAHERLADKLTRLVQFIGWPIVLVLALKVLRG